VYLAFLHSDGSGVFFSEAEPMEPVRCPYCVEGNDFKSMIPLGKLHVCVKCNHMISPNSEGFRCFCFKCIKMFQQSAVQP